MSISSPKPALSEPTDREHSARMQACFRWLYRYVKAQHYEGHDLFDGLNSRLFKHTPLYAIPWFRLALLQFCKRSPINVRPLLGVPKGFDPSGGAFFLMGHLNTLRRVSSPEQRSEHTHEARLLFEKLKERRLPRASGAGWGYNWDWQARAFFSPKSVPNLISSVYVGQAMLQAYRQFGQPDALSMAVDVARFLLSEMILFETDDRLCFRYVPGEDAEVHNANLKAAAYLAQVHAEHPLPGIAEKVRKAVRFSVAAIREDGSWPYGTKPFHAWMDNFHTAYNIQSLMTLIDAFNLDEYRPVAESVLEYYFTHLFTEDGTPKYYNTALYPIDSHVLAETLILLSVLKTRSDYCYDTVRADVIEDRVLQWVEDFQNPDGSIRYLKTARGWNKIPYIRWCQGKMFYALSRYLAAESSAAETPIWTTISPSLPSTPQWFKAETPIL